MRVQLKKGRDGPSTLVCIRADGSRTWAKVHPFFPVHDLTHYAVESVLGFREAFFGLIASGWSIDAFSEPGAAARLPAEAIVAEHIVGILDLERGTTRPLAAEEFNQSVVEGLQAGAETDLPTLSEEQLRSIRALRATLVDRWWALAPGETLDVPFPAVERAQASSRSS